MPNPTLMLFNEQIESVETDIEACELQMAALEVENSPEEHLLLGIQQRYRDLLVALKAARETLKAKE